MVFSVNEPLVGLLRKEAARESRLFLF